MQSQPTAGAADETATNVKMVRMDLNLWENIAVDWICWKILGNRPGFIAFTRQVSSGRT